MGWHCSSCHPGCKAIARLAKWAPLRNLMFTILDRRATGVLGGTLCRKRYIDEKLLEALSTGIQACVILGAGLDTRAYRLDALRAMQVFEVDLPENSAYKKQQAPGALWKHSRARHFDPARFREPVLDRPAGGIRLPDRAEELLYLRSRLAVSQRGRRAQSIRMAGSGTNREQVNLYLYPQGFYRWNSSLWLRHRVPDLPDGAASCGSLDCSRRGSPLSLPGTAGRSWSKPVSRNIPSDI